MSELTIIVDTDGDRHAIRLPDRNEELNFEYPYVYESINVSRRKYPNKFGQMIDEDEVSVYDIILDNRKYIHDDSKAIVFFKSGFGYKFRLINSKNARIAFRIPGGLFGGINQFSDLIGVEYSKDSEFVLESYSMKGIQSTFIKYANQDDFRLLASPTTRPQNIESIEE